MNKRRIKIFNAEKCVVEIVFDEQIILIDRKNLEKFAKYTYHLVDKSGKKYLARNGITGSVYFHNDIMNSIIGLEIDHINGNSLDNREANLRIVTHQMNQNNQNKKKGAASKYYGVSICREKKSWQVGVSYKGHRKNVGHFETEKEAANAYNNYLIKNNIPKRLNILED